MNNGKHAPRDAALGRLEVIRGCMFAGKTQRLIARLREAQAAGQRVVACKHAIDDRYDAVHLITHGQERWPAQRAAAPADIEQLATSADVIGIDEGQFFGTPLVEVVNRLRRIGRRVIVAGIDNDAWGRPFEPMPTLAAMADEDVLVAIACTKCRAADARYSQRMVAVLSNYMVGGPGDYEPRCAACFEPLPGPAPEQT